MGQTRAHWSVTTTNVISAFFVFVVLLFAAQGPLQEFVKWIVPLLTPDFEELSRREQRIALREGAIGASFQFLKLHVFSKTAIFLGVPLLASYLIVILSRLPEREKYYQNAGLALASLVVFGTWIITVWSRDNSLIYEPSLLDYLLFPAEVYHRPF